MKLTILTGCLLSLGLMGCSQNLIKSKVQQPKGTVAQQAVQGVNAVYRYPSFDYASQIKFEFNDPAHPGNTVNRAIVIPNALDPEIRQKLQQFFAAEQIHLKSREQQTLYQALSEPPQPLQPSSMSARLQKFSTHLLGDLDLSLNGSVHWREKQASMNLQLRYAKPTLLVQAQVPMVLDLKQHKFYSNFFALMPFLVNRNSQADYAYVDLAKYKDRLQQLDGRAALQFLQELSALPYQLAADSNLTRLSLTDQDRAQGAVDKIRLQSTLAESLLQTSLFLQVNEQYLLRHILKIDPASGQRQNLGQLLLSQASATSAEKVVKDRTATHASAHYQDMLNAYWQQLREQQQSDCDCGEDEASLSAETAKEVAPEGSVQQEQEQYLAQDLAQCQRLATEKQQISLGDAAYCLNVYAVDVLQPQDSTVSMSSPVIQQEKMVRLKQLFKTYDTGQLVTVQQFEALWQQHQTEIQAYLQEENMPLPSVVELGLDEQGRMLYVHNQFDLSGVLPQQPLRIRVDTQVSHYGQASAIDQQALKQAKPIAEVMRGSALDGVFQGVLKRSGMDDEASSMSKDADSLDQQLEQLATQVYTKKKDYLSTYNAVFLATLAQQQPRWLQHFSAQDLAEVASLHAYRYASEQYLPSNADLERHQQRWQQHQHWTEDSYQVVLGRQTASLVEHVIQKAQQKNRLKQLKQHSPKPEQQFSALYVQAYQQAYEDELNNPPPKELKQVADILGRAYAAQQKRALRPESFQPLKLSDEPWVDVELISVVFAQLEEK